MSAAGDQADAGKNVLAGGQPCGVDVSLQMVDCHERHAPGQGQGLCRRQPDQQRAGQPRGGGHRDGGQLVAADAGTLERFVNDRQYPLDVCPRSQLGDDASVAAVQIVLGGDDRGEDFQLVGDDGGGRLVAGGFDREDFHVETGYCARASCWLR